MISDPAQMPSLGLSADLADGTLLRMQAGERLWKLYLLRPAAAGAERIEHHIYTKEQIDGRIGLISYSLLLTRTAAPGRSTLAYARDIPKETLNQLIWNVARQTKLRPEELDVIDLTKLGSFAEQIEYLKALDAREEPRVAGET